MKKFAWYCNRHTFSSTNGKHFRWTGRPSGPETFPGIAVVYKQKYYDGPIRASEDQFTDAEIEYVKSKITFSP